MEFIFSYCILVSLPLKTKQVATLHHCGPISLRTWPSYSESFIVGQLTHEDWFECYFVERNEQETGVKEKNISIFICGINMSCVVSIYCTIHRVNRVSFSRQKGETAPVNMPPFYTQTDCIFFLKTVYSTIQNSYSTCVCEAVTRCRCIVKKIPEKFLTEVTFFFISFTFSFTLFLTPPTLLSTPLFF